MFFKKRRFFKISRISKKFINLLNINFFNDNNLLKFSSINNFILFSLNDNFFFKKNGNYLRIDTNIFNNNSYSYLGSIYSIISNIILGLTNFFEKKLVLLGIGYKVVLKYNFLYFHVGFSHPIVYNIPSCVNIDVLNFNTIVVKGVNKQEVGEISSKIKKIKIPDVYKGKGIRYFNEKIILKEIKKK